MSRMDEIAQLLTDIRDGQREAVVVWLIFKYRLL